MGEAIRRGPFNDRIATAVAIQPSQEIYKPIVECLRAFTWVRDWKPPEDKYAYLLDMTTAELLALVTAHDWKATSKYRTEARRAQSIVQQRYLAELITQIPDWGAWGGPTYLFDTETQNVERGQAMRFGVLQMRGLHYNEVDFFKRKV